MSMRRHGFYWFGDEYEVYWDGNVWVAPCNRAQYSTVGEAVRAELDSSIVASGDDDESLGKEIEAAIEQAAESEEEA